MRDQIESFKKMIFTMLNGKKKSVEIEDDEVEESKQGLLSMPGISLKTKSKAAGAYSVKCPSNKKGHKPIDPAKVKKMTSGPGPAGDRNDTSTYDITSVKPNKKGHKPIDRAAVSKMNKGKGSEGKVGSATPKAKLLPERMRRIAGLSPYVRPGLEESDEQSELAVDDFVLELAGIKDSLQVEAWETYSSGGAMNESDDDAPLGQGKIVRGMKLGDWTVVKASLKTISIAMANTTGSSLWKPARLVFSASSRFAGKKYQFRWDGTGYKRQGKYLTKSGPK